MHVRIAFSASIALVIAAGCGGGMGDAPVVSAKRIPQSGDGRIAAVDRDIVALAAVGKETGSFVGQVVYDGPVPADARPTGFDPADPKTDRFCVAKAKLIKDESLLVDRKTKGLKNVAVYLLRKPAGHVAAVPKAAVRFTNKNCSFQPRVLALVAGRKMTVGNDDLTSHNTHTFPLSPLTQAFNRSIAAGKSETCVYAGAEKLPVKVVCDIHPWMLGWHLPLDHEFFAVTNAKGEFTIKGLPAGTHKFRLWHEKAGYLEREIRITIKPGATERRAFKYAAAKFASFNAPTPKTVVVSLSK